MHKNESFHKLWSLLDFPSLASLWSEEAQTGEFYIFPSQTIGIKLSNNDTSWTLHTFFGLQ